MATHTTRHTAAPLQSKQGRRGQPPREQETQEESPHDEMRDLLRLLDEYGLTTGVRVLESGALSLPYPQSFSPDEVAALRERVRRLKGMLLAYFSVYPREAWPACFFDAQGRMLQCVRGHPYDLCRDEGEERVLCRCYYDLDFATRKRIGKEG